MNSARKLLSLSPREWRHLFEALVLVAGVRLGLTVLRYHRLSRLLDRAARAPETALPAADELVRELTAAVARASRVVPAATCLTQALAAQTLLGRRGIRATVHLGVARDTAKRFRAHAWLSVNGRVVLGGSGAQAFTPLTTMERLPEPAP